MVAQALGWTMIGVAFGLAAAFTLTRAFSTLLFKVSPSDLHVYAGVTLLTLGVGLAASFVPARRAATVDPVIALRQD